MFIVILIFAALILLHNDAPSSAKAMPNLGMMAPPPPVDPNVIASSAALTAAHFAPAELPTRVLRASGLSVEGDPRELSRVSVMVDPSSINSPSAGGTLNFGGEG